MPARKSRYFAIVLLIGAPTTIPIMPVDTLVKYRRAFGVEDHNRYLRVSPPLCIPTAVSRRVRISRSIS
jgi:hypothetical protein